MLIELEKCIVRSYQLSDAESLARYANNRKIWLNLRDGFPLEGRMRKSAIKDGKVIDQFLYAFVIDVA